jgi:hypothetical protein
LIFRTGLRHYRTVALLLSVGACGGGAPIGTVELGDLVVSGEVDGDYLYRQLGQLDPPFEACYMHAKRKDHSTEGVIQLVLQGGNNSLAGEITSNTTGSTELGDCVLAAISGLRIVEPENSPPWDFTADWSATFELARRNRTDR